MYHKYLIRMNEPEDWLRHWDEGTQVVNDFIFPYGPYDKNEMSDTIYHEGATVGYHQHQKGYETFQIAKGSVECIIRGKRFIAHAGDIIHLVPYTSHGFKFLEEGTIWRELFQEINMSQGIMDKNTVAQHYPHFREDPEFMDMYRGEHKSLTRLTPVPVDVDKHTMHEVRTPEFAYSEYSGEGFDIKLKVGKWETNGVKEIWQASVKKGLEVRYDYPHANWELYYVMKGALGVTVLGETFVAGPDCLVHIPPFHAHSIKVLEDAEVLDYGGETDLLALMEDLDSLKAFQSEKLEDAAFMQQFKRKYRCYVTDCHVQG